MTRTDAAGLPDALAALRQATGAAHARLDASLALAQPGAGLHAYASHLVATRGWLLGVQPCLARAGFGSADARLARIEADLIDLADLSPALRDSLPPVLDDGAQRTVVQAAIQAAMQADVPTELPAELPATAEDGAWCWGVAYVVEGSSLGGLVLYRRLREALHPHPLRYLAGDEPTASRWGAFIAALRARLVTPADVAAACDGAAWAFADFARRARAASLAAGPAPETAVRAAARKVAA